jgi:hypothetical protein
MCQSSPVAMATVVAGRCFFELLILTAFAKPSMLSPHLSKVESSLAPNAGWTLWTAGFDGDTCNTE